MVYFLLEVAEVTRAALAAILEDVPRDDVLLDGVLLLLAMPLAANRATPPTARATPTVARKCVLDTTFLLSYVGKSCARLLQT
jgi:hypothetical protein